jgi:hypothetical protein
MDIRREGISRKANCLVFCSGGNLNTQSTSGNLFFFSGGILFTQSTTSLFSCIFSYVINDGIAGKGSYLLWGPSRAKKCAKSNFIPDRVKWFRFYFTGENWVEALQLLKWAIKKLVKVPAVHTSFDTFNYANFARENVPFNSS